MKKKTTILATAAAMAALSATKTAFADEATAPSVEPVTSTEVNTAPTVEAISTTEAPASTAAQPTVATSEAQPASEVAQPVASKAAQPTFTPATTEQPTTTTAVAEQTPDTKITKSGDTITVENPNVKVEFPGGTGKYAANQVKYEDVHFPDDMEIKENDKVKFTLPEQFDFQTNYEFDVTNPEKAIIGHAVASRESRTVTTTFNNYFETHPLNKRMSFELDTRWIDKVESGSTQRLNFDGTVVEVKVGEESLPQSEELLDKWGSQDKDNPRQINWAARLNYSRRVLNAVQVIDKWSSNQEFVPGSLKMMEVTSVNPFYFGEDMTNLIQDLKVSDTGFDFKLSKLDKMVYLYYSTQLRDAVENSTNPTNRIELVAEGIGDHYKSKVQLVGGRGDASGEDLPVPATVDLEFTKSLAGRDLKDHEFNFELKDESGKVLTTASNTTDGKIKFGTLTFNQTGTFKYLVSEVKGTDEDVIYDPLVAEVTVTVDKNGNVFKASTILPNDTEFNNKVKETTPVNAQFEFTKALTGRKLHDGEFTFILKDEAGNVVQTSKNTIDGKIPFAVLNYTQPGVYKYTVEEVPSNEPGVTSDDMKANVTVEVTKEVGENINRLVAKATLPEDTEFNNVFVLPQPDKTAVDLKVNKQFINGELTDGKFTFELKDSTGQLIQTKTNNASGDIYFDKLEFDKPGDYVYTISEVTKDDEIDYDTKTITANIHVEYQMADGEPVLTNGKPTLLTKVTYSDNDNVADNNTTFTNTLATPTKAQLNFIKHLEGRDLKDKEFSFQLKDDAGNVLQTVTNDKNGNISFAPLTYTKLGTYNYEVSEVNTGDEDTIYDTTVAKVSVTVVRNGKILVSETHMPDSVTFTNSNKQTTPALANINFSKVLTGRDLKDKEFKFELKDESGKVIQVVSNDKDGNIKFNPIVFTTTGTYKYTVQEQKGTDEDIIYDPMVANVTINVTKSIGDTLNAFVATTVLPTDTQFDNKVKDEKPAYANIHFTKVLSGRELKDGEFMFALFEVNPNGDDIFYGFATNDAKGNIDFNNIEFKHAGDYQFYVVEVIGNDSTIKYDDMIAQVKVHVTKEIGDTLNVYVANVILPEDTEFNNTYIPPQIPKEEKPKGEKPKGDKPKGDKPKGETPTSTTPVKESNVLPKTGDANSALGLIGVMTLGLASLFVRKRKED